MAAVLEYYYTELDNRFLIKQGDLNPDRLVSFFLSYLIV